MEVHYGGAFVVKDEKMTYERGSCFRDWFEGLTSDEDELEFLNVVINVCVYIESNLDDDDEIHDLENEVPEVHVDMKIFKLMLIEENNKELGVEDEYMSNDSFGTSSSEGEYVNSDSN
ncbi:hypothetical protein QVD17_41402 [Tagetes erecta]|uniref:Uncharacterized protein n=1 Tax=Tagetes erecta TaxID=13708 RepID=A0AAD8JKE0_TARER|nr:hypothetical protein QVD17_41402 [Tagetes erecta]